MEQKYSFRKWLDTFWMWLTGAYQCCCRRQRWDLKDRLHMAPFEIHCNATLLLNHGVFDNGRAKQVEPGVAFNSHLEVLMDVRAWTFIHNDLQEKIHSNSPRMGDDVFCALV